MRDCDGTMTMIILATVTAIPHVTSCMSILGYEELDVARATALYRAGGKGSCAKPYSRLRAEALKWLQDIPVGSSLTDAPVNLDKAVRLVHCLETFGVSDNHLDGAYTEAVKVIEGFGADPLDAL